MSTLSIPLECVIETREVRAPERHDASLDFRKELIQSRDAVPAEFDRQHHLSFCDGGCADCYYPCVSNFMEQRFISRFAADDRDNRRGVKNQTGSPNLP